MTHHRPRRRGFTYVATALAVATLGLVAAVTALTTAEPAHAHVELDNALMVSTRDQLRVCVQQTPALAARSDVNRVVDGVAGQLDRARRHPDWSAAFGDLDRRSSRLVTTGCPSADLPDTLVTKGTVVGPGVTTRPSPFRTWIWVLDDATADRLIGPGRDVATASAELMRAGDHDLVTVSTSLLVRGDHLDDALLTDHFVNAVGLRPVAGWDTSTAESTK